MNFNLISLTDDELDELINKAKQEKNERVEFNRGKAREMLHKCLQDIQEMGFYVSYDGYELYANDVDIETL